MLPPSLGTTWLMVTYYGKSQGQVNGDPTVMRWTTTGAWISPMKITASLFFLDYTVQLRNSQPAHTHIYERTDVNPTPMSIFEDRAGKS